jgi:hypothetical protein
MISTGEKPLMTLLVLVKSHTDFTSTGEKPFTDLINRAYNHTVIASTVFYLRLAAAINK